jgi:hypothetical protein
VIFVVSEKGEFSVLRLELEKSREIIAIIFVKMLNLKIEKPSTSRFILMGKWTGCDFAVCERVICGKLLARGGEVL